MKLGPPWLWLPLRTIYCVCVCVPGQGKANPFLPISLHGYTIPAKMWEAFPPSPTASYLFYAFSISWQMSPMFHLPPPIPPPKGHSLYDKS